MTTHDVQPKTEDAPDDLSALALDTYSQVVSRVAAQLIPSVASLRLGGDGTGTPFRSTGAGSGVVITPDGFLLTSAHVVAHSSGGTASFSDGRELPFRVIGADPLSDLAIIRAFDTPDAASLPNVTLGDAERLVVGQLVVAVGNPLGFSGSVSAGVVSGLGRSMAAQAGDVTRLIDDVIQTDAALHPGNSGGALATSNGRVVGINTAVVGPNTGQGLSLAVPINAVTRRIIAQLMTVGRVPRARIGLGGGSRPLPPSAVRATGVHAGVQVLNVVSGGPADRAGIRVGDILLEVDHERVTTIRDLQRVLTGERVGQATPISFWRHDRVQTTVVVADELGG
jgi:S1-C subfamily serine protease